MIENAVWLMMLSTALGFFALFFMYWVNTISILAEQKKARSFHAFLAVASMLLAAPLAWNLYTHSWGMSFVAMCTMALMLRVVRKKYPRK